MRRKVFQETLPKALALADRVVLGGVFRSQQLGDDNRLAPDSVAEACANLAKTRARLKEPKRSPSIYLAKPSPTTCC